MQNYLKNYRRYYGLIVILFFLSILLFSRCSEERTHNNPTFHKDSVSIDTTHTKDTIIAPKIVYSDFEKALLNLVFVDIQQLDSTFSVEMRYSDTNNFVGMDMYQNFSRAFLQKDVAEMLYKAHQYLKDTVPDYRFLILDALRPKSIQKLMWDSVKMPTNIKRKYLSNPALGSLHNYGAAVDLTIIDSSGNQLDMGTPFDSFKELAQPALE
ncbi:MAG: hypothetical protein C0594_08050, partial [Marinilabiliales bacterium]